MDKKVKNKYIFEIDSTEYMAKFFQSLFENIAESIVGLMTKQCKGGVYDISFSVEDEKEIKEAK